MYVKIDNRMNEVFWIRMFCAEFDDPRWLAIEQLPDADAVQIIYVRMLMLAGRSNSDGLLLLHESLPYDVSTLAAVLRRTVPVVQFALATLERFKFIEMVDNVIAIAEWDRLQPTGELARLAERRKKDRERKRESRAVKKNLLLPSADMSADASVDSPRKSRTTNKESDSGTTTSNSSRNEEVVYFGQTEVESVMELVPPAERNKRIETVIADSIRRHGRGVTESNIRYALLHHDASKGRLGGMICEAVINDFDRAEREAIRAKEKARVAANAKRESIEAAMREESERDRKEALSHQAAWLALPYQQRVELARRACVRFPYLPEPTKQTSSVLDDVTVPFTKILAGMFARGEICLLPED